MGSGHETRWGLGTRLEGCGHETRWGLGMRLGGSGHETRGVWARD